MEKSTVEMWPGNDKNFGINIVNTDSEELKVFEASIDLMSYLDLTGDYKSNKLVLWHGGG